VQAVKYVYVINVENDNPVCYLVAKDYDKKGQNLMGSTIFGK